METWRAAFAEFIATFLFIFLGAGSIVITGTLTNGELTTERLVAIAMAHGLAIVLLAYATANISGGHINPAVTLAAWLTKNITTARASIFVLAQLAGAVLGALILMAVIPDASTTNLGAHALGPEVSIGMGLLMEIVVTFVLVFVIFATLVDSGGMGHMAPLGHRVRSAGGPSGGDTYYRGFHEPGPQLRACSGFPGIGRPLDLLGRTIGWRRSSGAVLPVCFYQPAPISQTEAQSAFRS